jgi:hypothetical protein
MFTPPLARVEGSLLLLAMMGAWPRRRNRADDAWEGLAGFIKDICEPQVEDRGFAEALTASGQSPVT